MFCCLPLKAIQISLAFGLKVKSMGNAKDDGKPREFLRFCLMDQPAGALVPRKATHLDTLFTESFNNKTEWPPDKTTALPPAIRWNEKEKSWRHPAPARKTKDPSFLCHNQIQTAVRPWVHVTFAGRNLQVWCFQNRFLGRSLNKYLLGVYWQALVRTKPLGTYWLTLGKGWREKSGKESVSFSVTPLSLCYSRQPSELDPLKPTGSPKEPLELVLLVLLRCWMFSPSSFLRASLFQTHTIRVFYLRTCISYSIVKIVTQCCIFSIACIFSIPRHAINNVFSNAMLNFPSAVSMHSLILPWMLLLRAHCALWKRKTEDPIVDKSVLLHTWQLLWMISQNATCGHMI